MTRTPADESDYDRLIRIKESWSRFNDVSMGDIVWLLRMSERALRAEAAPPKGQPPLEYSGGGSDLELRWSRDALPEAGEQHPTYTLYVGGCTWPVGGLICYCWPQLGDSRWRWSWRTHLPGPRDQAPGGPEAAETRTFSEARAELEDYTRTWFHVALPAPHNTPPPPAPHDLLPQLFFSSDTLDRMRSRISEVTPFEVGVLISDWQAMDRALRDMAPHIAAIPLTLAIGSRPAENPEVLAQCVRMAQIDGGSWQSCTGCWEATDGQPSGDDPYSPLLRCHLGGGCSECGGLGVTWNPPADRHGE